MKPIFFQSIPEFDRDVKKLRKKFVSIEEDLEVLRKVLRVCPKAEEPRSFRIQGLGFNSEVHVIKVKKIACKSLKGRGANSGLRLIYAYLEKDRCILLIQLYFKGSVMTEDRRRINAAVNEYLEQSQ